LKAALAGPVLLQADQTVSTRGLPSPTICDVRVIATEPAGVRLTVVRIQTDQDGLYGYGCATFTQRAELVNAAVEKYLKPFLIGKPADRIDDTWLALYNSSYWRNGSVLNNAISGIDQALWDIKGRQAGMPVYQLLGGKCREAAEVYLRVRGKDNAEVIDLAKKALAAGYRNVRLQVTVPGMAAYGAPEPPAMDHGLHAGAVFEPASAMRRELRLLEDGRSSLGEDVGLVHDMHERYPPNLAVQFCKAVEPLHPFYMEDALSPEDIGYFLQIRQNCATPLAMGELFNNPHEWTSLIAERLIDYIRIHVSQAGGVTPVRKIAAMCEIFGVKTAWHGPPDLSPVGHAANIALDLACQNFGIQECTPFDDRTREVFTGSPVLKDGYLYANEAPGWGIEVDEKAAGRYPYGSFESEELQRLNGGWGEVRRRDGSIIKQ
jgi:mannonate dehydratase